MVHEDRKAFVVYHVDLDKENLLKLDNATKNDDLGLTHPMTIKDNVALVWYEKDLKIVPYRTRYVDTGNLTQVLVREGEEGQRPIIGNELELKFDTLGGLVQHAKVDTGADMSSLHADEIKVHDDSVTFVIEGRRFTMNKAGSVDIQTADNGTEPRPIVKLTVTCDHCTVRDHEFNLNDRSDMPHKVLLGQDFLQHGNFLIDPLKESDTLLNQALNIIIEHDDKEIDTDDETS